MSTQTTEAEEDDTSDVFVAGSIAVSTCGGCHSPCIVFFDENDDVLSVMHCDTNTLKELMNDIQRYLYSRQQ